MNVLVIIPARGGSKGIPRKNLRPLNGKPLIYYSISLALRSSFKPDVYVSTDDEEIAYFSKRFGANVHYRDASLGGDAVTLDPVIFDAFNKISSEKKKQYDFVVTLQPTSPLLKTESLDAAIRKMIDSPGTETILSAVNDTHLTWGKDNNGYFPNYAARVNRQMLPPVYKETGGFFVSRAAIVKPTSRIGKKVDLYVVPTSEAIDIDSYEDWSLCEYFLRRKTILFNVSGYPEIGLGHVYNCLELAHQILDHKVLFLVDDKSTIAFNKIKENNFEVHMQQSEKLLDDIVKLEPHLVINDRLDTDAAFIRSLKEKEFKVINIEDLGEGARYADLVVNAIYPETHEIPNQYFGPDYFCAREEFLIHGTKTINENLGRVLLSFGGVDPNNYTRKVLESIYDFCKEKNIEIEVVLGLGYTRESTLEQFKDVTIYRNVQNISDHMFRADVAFSSAGRTIYELALVGTPSIVMAQNRRELSHFFASEQNGFCHLGMGVDVDAETILEAFKKLYNDPGVRKKMNQQMLSHDIRNGRKRVIKLIQSVINE